MKNFFLTTFIILISFSQTGSCRSKDPIKLTILHTNDHHGRYWPNKKGEYGLAARATLIKKIKEEVAQSEGSVLVLDAGDVNTGVPQSDLFQAEPDFRAMAEIGYDAMAVGNHEFDNPLPTLLKQQKEWAKFPFLSANIYLPDGKRVFPSHIEKNIEGFNVVIFGLTTEDTPKKSRPENSKNLFFKPVLEEVKTLVPKLRKRADALIALTHTGHYKQGNHGTDAPGDVSIARAVKGIDLIIGGHTQKPLYKADMVNGTHIVQAYEWGKYVGRIDLEISEKKVKFLKYELIPINLQDSKEKITQDKDIEDLLRPYKDKGDELCLTPIGKTDGEFQGERSVIRSMETNLGNLITRAYKEKFKADLAVVNSGGIRDSLYSGSVTIESVLMVLPFSGEVVTTTMSGKELKTYLQSLISNLSPGSGSYPQMSGVEILIGKDKKIISIKIKGKQILENSSYLIALPEFIAQGGDNYPVVKYRKYGYIDNQILMDYIKAQQTLRIQDYAPTGYLQWVN